MRRILLFSTSTVHGTPYMRYAVPYIDEFLGSTRRILFVPYARPSGITHDRYTELFRGRLVEAGYDVDAIHETPDPAAAVAEADAIFIGGGNTFVLLSALYEHGLIDAIRQRVHDGMPYMGSSAGSNVAGLSIGTTNDMPIVQPPAFAACALVPCNINPHYIDPDPGSTHMGETRETRINEFHCFNEQPVVALREGAMLRVLGDEAEVDGTNGGRLFRAGAEPTELQTGDRLDEVMSAAIG
jgi:dipeptidase E